MNSSEDHQAPTSQARVSPLSSPHRSGTGEETLPIRPSQTTNSVNPASPSETPASTNPASPSETLASTNPAFPPETPASTNPASPSETPASTNPASPSETLASTNPASPPETPASTNPASSSETPASNNPASSSETPASNNPASPSETLASTNPASSSETPASTNPASPSETPASTNPASSSETPASTNPASPSETPASTNPASPAETPISNNPSNPVVLPHTPPKLRTAREVFSVLQCEKERSPQHKTPQMSPEQQPKCSSDTHPCVQWDTQMEAVTGTQPLPPKSPVPEDRCQTPDIQTGASIQPQVTSSPESGCQGLEARSETPSPSKGIQMCCEVENRPNLSTASVGHGETVGLLTATIGRLPDSEATGATELCGESRQNSSFTDTGMSSGKCVRRQQTIQSPLNRMDLRRRPNETKSHQGNRPQCTDQKSEIVKIERKTSVKPSTDKVDRSNENLRKRKYPSKCKTSEVESGQEESLAKRKKVSKVSPTRKVEPSQESGTKRKRVSKVLPMNKVKQSQECVTKRKKVSKIPGTDKVSQETVKKRKSTKNSPSDKTDQSQETMKNGKKTTKSKTNKMEKVPSIQSQSCMVEHSCEKTLRNGAKASRKSQKDKLQSLATESQKSVKIREYSRKPQNCSKVSAHPSSLPVRSPDRSSSLSSGMLNSPGVQKRRYTKKSPTQRLASDFPSSDPVLSEDLSPSRQGKICPPPSPAGLPWSPNTPKRARGRARPTPQKHVLCSTPDVHSRTPTRSDHPTSVYLSPLGLNASPITKTKGPQNATPITKTKGPQNASTKSLLKTLKSSHLEKTAQLDLGLPVHKCQSRTRVRNAATAKNKGGTETKAAMEGGFQSCTSEEKHQAKHVRRGKRGQTDGSSLQSDKTASADQHCRPRFELLDQDSLEKDPGDSSMSSDLSIELSLWEDHVTSTTFEAEEQEDEEELPSFLNTTKPLPITEGICVWCKFRNYPFWPAVVKSVNRKLKKASIVFIDNLLLDEKGIRKGFTVALKTLKPFDCEEADQLVCKAKEKYEAAIKWCLELIDDYRIRIGCGFTGSFIEYFSDNISCPMRRRYPQGSSDLTFPSKQILEEQHVTSDPEGDEAEERDRQEKRRKLLPDRSKAARNRTNEKLVDFIVRQRRVETRLLGIICGQQQSKYLRRVLAARRSVMDTYLEDEEQLDQVIEYLTALLETAPSRAPCLADVDSIRLVLDVLLPEAVIYAIAGVEELPLDTAEKKYLQGHTLSKRERQEFDEMIEEQMKMKASIPQCLEHGT